MSTVQIDRRLCCVPQIFDHGIMKHGHFTDVINLAMQNNLSQHNPIIQLQGGTYQANGSIRTPVSRVLTITKHFPAKIVNYSN